MPGRSRWGDYLYRLYLASFAWLMLPFFGSALALLLPTEWDRFGNALNLAVPMLALVGAWSGSRGGPLLVSQASVIHELLSAGSQRTVLAPHMVRQAVSYLVVAALATSLLWSMVDSGSPNYRLVVVGSGVAGLAAAGSLFQAVLWLVGAHGLGLATRAYSLVAAIAVPAIQVAALLLGVSFTTPGGLLVLVATVALGGLLAVTALEEVPVETLWRRAGTVNSLSAVMLTADFQGVFLELRRVAERVPAGRPTPVMSRWLPIPVWRLIASMRHNPAWPLGRIVVLASAMTGMAWWGSLGQGLVTLALSACTFFVGLEFAGPVSETTSHPRLVAHYRLGSVSVLGGQAAVVVAGGLVLGFASVGFGLIGSVSIVHGVLLLALCGSLGATMQARLGSPDLGATVQRYGFELAGAILWLRALFTPLVVLVCTVGVFHSFFYQGASKAISLSVGVVALTGAFFISIRPIQGSSS